MLPEDKGVAPAVEAKLELLPTRPGVYSDEERQG